MVNEHKVYVSGTDFPTKVCLNNKMNNFLRIVHSGFKHAKKGFAPLNLATAIQNCHYTSERKKK